MAGDMICLLGQGIECANCADASWYYRGEQPILNDTGVKFCSVECADEYDTRVEAEQLHREIDWCPQCGFDNHEHQDWCPTLITPMEPR